MTSLEPGNYHFEYKIPPYTFANGEYILLIDLAEKNMKRYTTNNSKLTFNIVQGKDNFGNVFAENIDIKSSIIRPDWLISYKQKQL